MRIGLLVSELQDDAVRRMCIGADVAAKKFDVNLCILPGKYLPGNMNNKAEQKFEYQDQAIFDYISDKEFDILIVDIEKIGINTTILKKEELLKRFGEIPILTISEQEGFTNVNLYDDASYEQQGYLAVHDAIYYLNNRKLPELLDLNTIKIPDIKIDNNSVYNAVKLGNDLLIAEYKKCNVYKKIAQYVKETGINNLGIFIFEKPIINSLKEKWKKAENIKEKLIIRNGQEQIADEVEISTNSVFKECEVKEQKTQIAKNIYVDENQHGIIVSEFKPATADIYYQILFSMIISAWRISDLTIKNEKIEKDLNESREELAKDGSVLDHIGDTDYLTGLLNRRGFFDKAYEEMQNRFIPATYVVVAYIDMASIKNINEMFGHDEGDRAVKRVASMLNEVFGQDSIYGRIRGDEFAVLNVTDDESKAEKFKLQMSEQNARLMTESGRYLNHLQFSICEFSYEDNMSLRDMLKETDNNLKKMKSIEINK